MVVAAAAADGGGLWGSQRRNDLARREHISRLFLFRLALQYLYRSITRGSVSQCPKYRKVHGVYTE